MNTGIYLALAIIVAVIGGMVYDFSRQRTKRLREQDPGTPVQEQLPLPEAQQPAPSAMDEEQRFPPIQRPESPPPATQYTAEELPPVERVVVRRLETPVLRRAQELLAVWQNRMDTMPYGSPKTVDGRREALQECIEDFMALIAELEQMEEENEE